MHKLYTPILMALLLATIASCSKQKPRYVIGVSQCSADIWREKQNDELRMGTYFRDSVELRFAAAYDSDERQVQQIDSLLSTGIDLLIVAPNQVQTISPAIDRAYDMGIPVIVFERKTNSKKYTAFISADNYEMGRQMGQYIATQLGGHGQVAEIMGLRGSSPAIERHKGFADVMARYPDIHIVATLQGDWTEESGYKATQEWLAVEGVGVANIDYVFGQNDRMAMGARNALSALNSKLPKFCGIDGLPGKGGGIELVRDSILDASYIYPTHGDQLLDLAVDILDGRPYNKEVKLKSALVTRDNANVLLMQSEEMMRQTAWIDQLHQKADGYMRQLDTQRTVTLLAFIGIALLLIAITLFYLYHISKVRLHQERVVNTLWNMKPEDTAPAAEQEKATADDAEPAAAVFTPLFLTKFREAVESRLDDSDLSVEDLAAIMNLSRVQLYRKVKQCTGSTPVELLRKMRLNRGYQLLATTDKTVSEVAYLVGFTAPSYFTKCFKEEYGMLPGDVRRG
ncbi:MAG: substrate-binding domain-containing protein [Prevotella sp.]|nr:substrate-binding domain-containing protein [Prevotella sp.]